MEPLAALKDLVINRLRGIHLTSQRASERSDQDEAMSDYRVKTELHAAPLDGKDADRRGQQGDQNRQTQRQRHRDREDQNQHGYPAGYHEKAPEFTQHGRQIALADRGAQQFPGAKGESVAPPSGEEGVRA